MKNTTVIYKNNAKLKIQATSKKEFANRNIPFCDTIKLSFLGIGKGNSECFYMTPDEILDLGLICIQYLADNNFVKRRKSEQK